MDRSRIISDVFHSDIPVPVTVQLEAASQCFIVHDAAFGLGADHSLLGRSLPGHDWNGGHDHADRALIGGGQQLVRVEYHHQIDGPVFDDMIGFHDRFGLSARTVFAPEIGVQIREQHVLYCLCTIVYPQFHGVVEMGHHMDVRHHVVFGLQQRMCSGRWSGGTVPQQVPEEAHLLEAHLVPNGGDILFTSIERWGDIDCHSVTFTDSPMFQVVAEDIKWCDVLLRVHTEAVFFADTEISAGFLSVQMDRSRGYDQLARFGAFCLWKISGIGGFVSSEDADDIGLFGSVGCLWENDAVPLWILCELQMARLCSHDCCDSFIFHSETMGQIVPQHCSRDFGDAEFGDVIVCQFMAFWLMLFGPDFLDRIPGILDIGLDLIFGSGHFIGFWLLWHERMHHEP